MHQGNWKCSKCGGTITELPFVPRSEAGLTCRACYAKGKNSGGSSYAPAMNVATEAPDIPFDAELAGEPAPPDDFGMETSPVATERGKFSGNWQCAGCGAAITSLPFQPRSTSNLQCIDCFKRSRA